MFSPLQKRIIEITFEQKLAHLSSTLSAAPYIEEIFRKKKDDEIFILSNGHAGLALYCALEQKYGINAVELLEKHGIHPNKDIENHLYCSAGSLGCGLPIAVGHALSTPNKKVYVMISDGECAEGSIWEALRYIDEHVPNLEVYANINGQGAYKDTRINYLCKQLKDFLPRIHLRLSLPFHWSFAKGLETHYCNLTKENYEELLRSPTVQRHVPKWGHWGH
jgi:transketolase